MAGKPLSASGYIGILDGIQADQDALRLFFNLNRGLPATRSGVCPAPIYLFLGVEDIRFYVGKCCLGFSGLRAYIG